MGRFGPRPEVRGRHRAVALALACALLAASPEPAFTARVRSVADGDSLVVSPDVRVRLFGIDSPEGDQPYGDRARAELSRLVAGRVVTVTPVDRDDYGRVVARVSVGERDVNAELVRAGAAWVYRRYTDDPMLLAAEAEAREARRGIWSLAKPDQVPPWDWRHGTRTRDEAAFKCGAKRFCREMKSCAEARFYLVKCGVKSLDGDDDGRPCASLCRVE
jgi:endonuclease YncB( thermonuclease family)